jgi:hypothetical protein
MALFPMMRIARNHTTLRFPSPVNACSAEVC